MKKLPVDKDTTLVAWVIVLYPLSVFITKIISVVLDYSIDIFVLLLVAAMLDVFGIFYITALAVIQEDFDREHDKK